MMTKLDEAEEEATGGIIKGGATLTTLLGLRHIMLKNKPSGDAGWKDFRCVIHTETNVTIPGTGKDYMEGAKFTNNIGQDVVHLVDLRAFVNTLMLTCTAQPGLSAVFLELLSFEGVSFRSKAASQLGVVGMKIKDMRYRYNKAIVAGVVSTKARLNPQKPQKEHGMACDAEWTITEDDRIVLISDTISPKVWDGKGPAANRKILPGSDKLMGEHGEQRRLPFDIMVCGWRPEWNNATRFAARVEALARSLPKGSVSAYVYSKSKLGYVF